MRVATPAAAIACLIMGCAGFYTAPRPERPVGWPEAPIGPAAAIGAAIDAADAAELAVFNSLELRSRGEALESREGSWRLGLRAWFPRVEAGIGQDERLSLDGPDSFTKYLSVSLNQRLWDGGRLAAVRALERSDIEMSRDELKRESRRVGELAVSAYRSVIAARTRLDIKRSTLEAVAVEYGLVVTEASLGAARPADVAEAALRKASAALEARESELAVTAAEDELLVALGLPSLPPLSGSLDLFGTALPLDERRVVDEALKRSPALASARYALGRAFAEERLAAFAWLPSIGAEASAYASGDGFPLRRLSWSLALTLDFSSPSLAGGIKSSSGGEPPSIRSAGRGANLDFFPDPASIMTLRDARIARSLAEERRAEAAATAERSARAALKAYAQAALRRDLVAESICLARDRASLVSLESSLGRALRSERVKAELELASMEADLVNAAAALSEAERAVERILDLPPGSLGAFFEYSGGAGL